MDDVRTLCACRLCQYILTNNALHVKAVEVEK